MALPNEKFEEIKSKIQNFIDNEMVVHEDDFNINHKFADHLPFLEEKRNKVREMGLFAPQISKEYGGLGLSLHQLGQIYEILGKTFYGLYVFNCQAPDAGNMEILIEHGTDYQKETFLKPLVEGKVRSCFSMTEPEFAGSNPVIMGTTAVKDGSNYVINGHKWFTSSADGADFAIVMVITDPDHENPYMRASQIIVPTKTKGFNFIRNISVMGDEGDGWNAHAEIIYDNCIVPEKNVLGPVGAGFKIAQERLGPGRIHHCMRAIGAGEVALELMCKRGMDPNKVAFGKNLAQLGANFDYIAESRIELNAARFLTLDAAVKMDTVGNKIAASEIAQIKVYAPNVALKIIDRAIQIHGGEGVSQLTPLASMYAHMRTLRLADGPDEVHRRAVARYELGKYMS